MKKFLFAVTVCLTFCMAMSGCSVGYIGGADGPTAVYVVPDSSSSEGSSSASRQIGEEGAKKIAFDNAGVEESKVSNLSVWLDKEVFGDVYEVEFYADGVEYDYEINAATGEIVSMDKDAESLGNTPSQQPAQPVQQDGGAVSADQAKQIALEQAGIQESDAGRLKTEHDFDDGREIYEVEFFYNGAEYTYEINAADGSVISSEIDRD